VHSASAFSRATKLRRHHSEENLPGERPAPETHGLTEQQRYPIQHQLGFQVWDLDLPHFAHAHGRSLLGHQPGEQELADVEAAREQMAMQARFDGD
jgi:hypothetical protein